MVCGVTDVNRFLKKTEPIWLRLFFVEVSWGYVSFWAGVIPFCDCEFFELRLFHSAIASSLSSLMSILPLPFLPLLVLSLLVLPSCGLNVFVLNPQLRHWTSVKRAFWEWPLGGFMR